MNHISSKYLRWLRWIFILYCSHFAFIYLYLGTVRHQWSGTKTFPIGVVILVGAQFIYEIIATIKLLKWNTFVATSITVGFMLFETGIVFNPTGAYHSPYLVVLLVTAFVTGALGWLWPLVEILLLFLFYLSSLSGFLTTSIKANKVLGIAEIGAVVLVSAIGFLFWRSKYDSTENKQLDQLNNMLKDRQVQSNIIIESIADGVIVFDTYYKAGIINPSASALTEWPINDATGLDIHLVMKLTKEGGEALDSNSDIFSRSLNNKQNLTETFKLIGQHNKQTTISLLVSPIVVHPNETIAGGVAIFRDITKQRQEEQQRVEFISTASHEMRTPVAAIEGYLALALNDKVSRIDSQARGYLEKAHGATQHLGKLFQDLLTSSKADDGRLSNHPAVVEMGSLVDQLTSDLRFNVEKKKLDMQVITNASTTKGYIDASGANSRVLRPLYYVYADPERLREVITNLIDNAIKYTEVGKISIGLAGDDNNVQLFIKDTGPGIPADDLPHLFQKFYRVDNTKTRTIGGTGLGLYISKKIIDLYNGRIWAESTVGQGSTFYISLPRLTTQRAEQLKTRETSTPAKPPSVTAMTT